MKYLNLSSTGSKLESVTCKFTLMAASEDNFILEIFLNGCFSKTAAKYIYFKISRLHIFYLSYFDVKLKRDEFLKIFFK